MIHVKSVVMAVVAFSCAAEANPARGWESWCSSGHHHESYGLGLGEGYLGKTPTKDHSGHLVADCFRAGYQRGEQILKEHERFPERCRSVFSENHAEGLEAVWTGRIPSECANAGYRYGLARLGRGARARDGDQVGSGCVREYERGYSHARGGRAHSPPDFERKLVQCYFTGYWDGGLR